MNITPDNADPIADHYNCSLPRRTVILWSDFCQIASCIRLSPVAICILNLETPAIVACKWNS